jgi:glyceraldehyde 3-phosphate dehydrogenase
MAIKIGINGFGRIGRLVARAALERKNIEIVGVNDLFEPKILAHLFKYDSVHRTYPGTVEATADAIVIDGKKIAVTALKDPSQLPWKAKGAEVVIESTGIFRKKADAEKHIAAGAKKVVISAPADDPDVTLCMGVNDNVYDPAKHNVISNASCTTNCLAPMMKVLLDTFGVKRGLMTTIHSYTNDQRILDLAHKDLRRARAAAMSSIPTKTGAAKAIGLVMPELDGKMNGISIRVPTPDVSLTDVVVELEKSAKKEDILAAFKKAAAGAMKGIMEVCEEPLVSSDFIGSTASCIIDAENIFVMGGTMVKALGWYDNEWAYSCRCVDLVELMAKK